MIAQQTCQLMDGFGLLIQSVLFLTVLITLMYKRATETPQRPLKIWALDVSKQFIGAGMLHCINISISYAAKDDKRNDDDLCAWYFLNLAMDTTVGVLLLWCWLPLFMAGLERLGVEIGKTGDYGQRWKSRWTRQLIVFLSAEILTKACLYEIIVYLPWFITLAKMALDWTGDNPHFQLVFVMLIFPLVMNALQFWLTDTILKVQQVKEEWTINKNERTPLFMA
ncbi:vacuolar membrane protein-domain-containing protein [Gilbertella persicaria]|uniref:vacuolar membrane protein-domain-containing protein n=1 Tax=Gilbertella persicaria TaxID=101096 RepID=UPI0022208662|nr:vacuolar membrane protein-domain-containing protein [Gilbertella persicaria]KAI8079614.1 vacuolar membrane protein-domain-containing protein [Gilbertella persicaria]